MRGLNLVFMATCFILASCGRQDALDSRQRISDLQIEALQSCRLGWMSVSVAALSQKVEGEALEEDFFILNVIGGVASEASYKMNGARIDMTEGYGLLRRLRNEGLIDENRLRDPLGLNDYLDSELPRSELSHMMLSSGIHPKTIKDKSSYEEFCVWFQNQIE